MDRAVCSDLRCTACGFLGDGVHSFKYPEYIMSVILYFVFQLGIQNFKD
jgi:hypothetical protein